MIFSYEANKRKCFFGIFFESQLNVSQFFRKQVNFLKEKQF